MGDGNFKWYLAASEDAEIFDGQFDTQDEARASGLDNYENENFVLIEADKAVVRPTFAVSFVVERILEDLDENNPECWGEDGSDDAWNNVNALENAIEKAVACWLEAYPPKTFCVDTWRNVLHFPVAA